MPKNRVVVVVEGGLVQSVACEDPETEVLLVDWDNLKADRKQLDDVAKGNPYEFPADVGTQAVDRYIKEAADAAKERLTDA